MITKSTNGYIGDSKEDKLARGLGWFSIALGLTQLLAPRKLSGAIGVEEDHTLLMRLLGLRELTAGVGLLTQEQPRPWLKARVVGDVMDIGLLGAAMTSSRNDRLRVALAAVGVAAVTRLDYQACKHFSDTTDADISSVRVTRSVIIDRPANELFAFWRNLENLPRIMSHVESVRVMDERHSHWRTRGPAGTSMEWEAEIVSEQQDELIAWRSHATSKVQHVGCICFSPAPGNRGTLVKVELQFHPPAGALGMAMAKILGESPEKQIAVDLARFKQLMEAGEIARTKHQPTGRRRSLSVKYDELVRA